MGVSCLCKVCVIVLLGGEEGRERDEVGSLELNRTIEFISQLLKKS